MENWLSSFDRIPNFFWNIILIAAAIAAGLLIRFIIIKSMRFYYKRSGFYLFNEIVDHLYRPAGYFLPLIMLNVALPFMRMGKVPFHNLDRAIEIALTISFATILISTIRVFQAVVFHVYDITQADNLKARRVRTQLQYIRQLIIALIVILTVAAILLSFENLRKLGTGLLGGVAIGATIVGFAAQQSLGNLLAGFQIAFTQPIRIDDVLVVEGEWGKVEEITLTYVVLKIWDERRLILPISYFINNPFQNWTRQSSDILGTVFLYMDYNVPVDEVRAEFTRLLQMSKQWDGRVNALQVTDSKERTIELRALMSSRNSGDAFDLRCFIRENLIKFISKNYPDSLPVTRAEVKTTEQLNGQINRLTQS